MNLILWIIAAIGLLATVVTVQIIFGFICLYYYNNQYKKTGNTAYQPLPIIQTLYLIPKEIFYNSLNYIFKLLNTGNIPNKSYKKVILLVHGYNRTKYDFYKLKSELQVLTSLPTLSVNLKPNFVSIAEISKNLASKINLINCEEIVLIGHSMGGLVASFYAEFLNNKQLVKKVITIGSPLHGTEIAKFGFSDNAKEMRLSSKFTKSLQDSMKSSKVNYHHIPIKIDHMIIPWNSSIMDKQASYNTTGHLSALHDLRLVKAIFNLL